MLGCLRLVGKLVLKILGNCSAYFQKQKKKAACSWDRKALPHGFGQASSHFIV